MGRGESSNVIKILAMCFDYLQWDNPLSTTKGILYIVIAMTTNDKQVCLVQQQI